MTSQTKFENDLRKIFAAREAAIATTIASRPGITRKDANRILNMNAGR